MWQKKDIVNEFQRLGKRITKQRMVILDVILGKTRLSPRSSTERTVSDRPKKRKKNAVPSVRHKRGENSRS